MALKGDKYNLQAHRMYGQGITDQHYSPIQYPDTFEKSSTGTGKIFQHACSTFEQTDYENSSVYFYQGLILNRTQRPKEALKALQKSIKIFPLNFDTYLELMHFSKQENKNKLTQRYLKKMHDLQAGPFYSKQCQE